MTLAAIISAYEAHRAAQTVQEPALAALTPKGEATCTVYRLRTQLAALEPTERAEFVGLMFAELDLIAAPAPLPAEKDSRYCFFHGEYSPEHWDCPTCPAA